MGKGGGMHKPMGWGNGRHGRECKGEGAPLGESPEEKRRGSAYHE